ncbi:MAG: ribosome silencing factor [Deltaproteobacteria bacterium]|nr:ribosome silencing factor [Deltaproteobacteria bacterium]
MNDSTRNKAELIIAAARETKAFDPVLLKVDQISSIADYFFICSGRSSRQVQAIAGHILEEVKKKGGHVPLGAEGKSEGRWVLIDFGEVIVHVFYHSVREFYDLEGLWVEAESIELNQEKRNERQSASSLADQDD